MKIAYQGIAGAFGHQACLAFCPDHEPVAKPSFGDVVNAVETGETEFGMLPVENSAAGPVEEAQELLAGCLLHIASEHLLPIRMHLLGLPSARLENIRTAVSHPMALRQCAQTLARLGLEAEEAPNTAVAAKALIDPTKAVLASEAAAEAYGLTILMRDVHDQEGNATRFVVLARDEK